MPGLFTATRASIALQRSWHGGCFYVPRENQWVKTFSALEIISVLFFATLMLAQIGHAQVYVPATERETALRNVFGYRVAEGLTGLSGDRFDGARQRAMDLAEKVEDHDMSVKEARSSLLAVLLKMNRGESLAGFPDPEFEIVGVIQRGSALGKETSATPAPTVASALWTETLDSAGVPVSAVKKAKP